MDQSFNNERGNPDPSDLERKGSVRRAREMLEAGQRPKIRAPQSNGGVPPPRTNRPPMNQWPLSNDNYLQTPSVDPQPRLWASRGPPPQRPPRPDVPSPSIYSERSVSDASPSPLNISHPPSSFPQSVPNQQHLHPALRGPVIRESVDMFRKSAASSTGSVPSISEFPQPVPQPVTQRKMVNLAPPAPTMRGPIMNRRSSVSPIPEELPDSPTLINKPYAPSQVTASSWSSEKAESDILGTYLDVDSDGSHEVKNPAEDVDGTLVRQASLGKRGKPSLRTIHKPNVESHLASEETSRAGGPQGVIPEATLKEVALGLNNRDSFSSISSLGEDHDPEKGPIMLEQAAAPRQLVDNATGALPKSTPTMSEMRPGARRPPRLDMNAVRDAEKRGSLTSLSDLIRRATKLASNLEHGRTASRNDLLNVGGGSKFPFKGDNRRSGSIKDLLASFPPPAATPEGRSSWPMFFRRSNLHHLTSQETEHEGEQETRRSRRHRCCGMPLWLFIVLCVLFILIVAAAVLLPIFLVVVPREKGNGNGISSSSSSSSCDTSSPCQNGGVSVSSGDVCSCVCVNGFTGSRCTTAGDASCITAEISQGSTSRNATVGDDLPRLFEDSQGNFSIPLDPITIMALFSQNNVSCTTENALVSFQVVSSSNNSRRAFPLDSVISDGLFSEIGEPPAPVPQDIPTPTLAARNTVATENGIVYDDTPASGESSEPTPSPTKGPKEDSQSTVQPTSTPTSTPVSSRVLDFSRISVLYILEKTGTLDAAMYSADNIETYLSNSYSSSKTGTHLVELDSVGVKGNFTLNFNEFTITNFDGVVVGGGQ